MLCWRNTLTKEKSYKYTGKVKILHNGQRAAVFSKTIVENLFLVYAKTFFLLWEHKKVLSLNKKHQFMFEKKNLKGAVCIMHCVIVLCCCFIMLRICHCCVNDKSSLCYL